MTEIAHRRTERWFVAHLSHQGATLIKNGCRDLLRQGRMAYAENRIMDFDRYALKDITEGAAVLEAVCMTLDTTGNQSDANVAEAMAFVAERARALSLDVGMRKQWPLDPVLFTAVSNLVTNVRGNAEDWLRDFSQDEIDLMEGRKL